MLPSPVRPDTTVFASQIQYKHTVFVRRRGKLEEELIVHMREYMIEACTAPAIATARYLPERGGGTQQNQEEKSARPLPVQPQYSALARAHDERVEEGGRTERTVVKQTTKVEDVDGKVGGEKGERRRTAARASWLTSESRR